MKKKKRKYECALRKQEGGVTMKVKDFLLNEIKSGEYRLNTDRSLAEFDGQLKCIYHLQSSPHEFEPME